MSVQKRQHTPLLHADELIPECIGMPLEEAAFQKDCESNNYEGILLMTKSVNLYGKLSIYVEGKGDWQGTASQRATSTVSPVWTWEAG